jgi:penicillin-insensitive murein DD-endopeptidase
LLQKWQLSAWVGVRSIGISMPHAGDLFTLRTDSLDGSRAAHSRRDAWQRTCRGHGLTWVDGSLASEDRHDSAAISGNRALAVRMRRALTPAACALGMLAWLACSLPDSHAAAAPAKKPASPPDTSARDASATQPQPSAAVVPGPVTADVPKAEIAHVPTWQEVLALDGSVSTSLGGPSNGHVRGAIALPDRGPGFYHNTTRPERARFGTVELVQAIVRAAAIVDNDLPGSSLTVNDLGLFEGGPIAQHGSHQAGRDADILYYSQDAHGEPIPSVGVPIDPQGLGVDFKNLLDPKDDQPIALDVRRTWHFVAALLTLTEDTVQRIFVVEHVRSMLLAEAARVHAPKPLIARFADITCQPEAPHDDHLHVRLFCTPEDMAQGCRDASPIYPFRAQALKALGLKPLLASPLQSRAERDAVAARTTSPAQARKRAGPMHALVLKFLAEREAWRKRPSPGRPYCK